MQELEPELRRLLLSGCGGDAGAYQRFLTGTASVLRSYFRKRMQLAQDEVEDLVQEVLIAIHTKKHTYDAAQPLSPWLYGIAHYKLVDFYRRHSAAPTNTVDIDEASDWLAVEETEAQDAKRDVAALLDELPAKQRDSIHLVKIEGLSIAEAAKRTGQSESSVKVGIHRGLKSLAAKMREVL